MHYQKLLLQITPLCFVAMITGCKPGEQKSETSSQDTVKSSTVIVPQKTFTAGVEGPAVDANGILYAVNFASEGTIGMLDAQEKPSLFVTLPEGSVGNGIRFSTKGEMFIADYPKHNILKVDMGSRAISVFAHEDKMNQPNDIAIDDQNRLYASDPNWKENTGNLWRIDTDGKVTLLEDSMGTSNGVEVSPDNKTLYVNESAQRNVWAYDLAPDGSISNKRILITFPDFGMDGMRCDEAGNLYIARYGKGTVAILSPQGKVLYEVALTGKSPTNLAFGGPDGKTVYVTLQDQGNIEKFQALIPGREWRSAHPK
ncbi:SMP-30/gluconolactonase/LRE family protein [Chryseolinea sp. T2]|uniref:SMP-30/gluconolactonase/LRE family protein n=1 Tax=Chryseolinea sp. T2 TaxID=3129255 RepID=UPI0030784217